MSRKTDYTKRYKKKVATKFVIAVGSVVILSLVIISYLGSLAGNYTVQLSRDDRELTMADNLEFKNPTSRLRAARVENGTIPITYNDLGLDENLDKDNSKSHNGYHIGPSGGSYLAYTFYVKNLANDPQEYYVQINIDKIINTNTLKGAILADVLRVMVYENPIVYDDEGGIIEAHQKKIYAKKIDVENDQYNRYTTSEDGQIDNRECIYYDLDGDGNPHVPSIEEPRAIAFEEGSGIVKSLTSISSKQIIRYTVVMWFEGTDPECTGNAPVGAGITLSMTLGS